MLSGLAYTPDDHYRYVASPQLITVCPANFTVDLCIVSWSERVKPSFGTTMHLRTSITLLMMLAFGLAGAVGYANTGPGTTPNITEVLHGRCQEYRLCLMGDPCLPHYPTLQCETVVETFLNAIRHMDPCLTPSNAFDEFLRLAPPTTGRDMTMFWSGVLGSNIPQDVAQVTPYFTVLEETLAGFMAGNLSWCGSTDLGDPSGLNFTVCPTWTSDTCSNNTKATFWGQASKLLAQQAVGETYVVLNSQRRGGAFNRGSVFASIEAPNLNPDTVTNVAIYLLPDFTLDTPNDMYRETCFNGSIIEMKNMLTDLGFNHTCEEDPTIVMWLQCARYPDNPYCGPFNSAPIVAAVSAPLLLAHVLVTALFGGWYTR